MFGFSQQTRDLSSLHFLPIDFLAVWDPRFPWVANRSTYRYLLQNLGRVYMNCWSCGLIPLAKVASKKPTFQAVQACQPTSPLGRRPKEPQLRSWNQRRCPRCGSGSICHCPGGGWWLAWQAASYDSEFMWNDGKLLYSYMSDSTCSFFALLKMRRGSDLDSLNLRLAAENHNDTEDEALSLLLGLRYSCGKHLRYLGYKSNSFRILHMNSHTLATKYT